MGSYPNGRLMMFELCGHSGHTAIEQLVNKAANEGWIPIDIPEARPPGPGDEGDLNLLTDDDRADFPLWRHRLESQGYDVRVYVKPGKASSNSWDPAVKPRQIAVLITRNDTPAKRRVFTADCDGYFKKIGDEAKSQVK